MEFEINEFTNGFKKTIDWMLNDKYGDATKKFLNDLYKSRNIKEELDSIEALILLTRIIKTGGFHLKETKVFLDTLDSFREQYGGNFRVPTARDELIELVGPNSMKKAKMEKLLLYPTLKQFTDDLYNSATQNKTEILGKKGRDNYLRDVGYWDRIPIDRHEMRFIVRSGIFHVFSHIDKSDHLDYNHLESALTNFCNKCLKDYFVEGINLGNAPGVVDAFIWTFSAEDKYNICGATPQCNKCPLNGTCLYSVADLSRKFIPMLVRQLGK